MLYDFTMRRDIICKPSAFKHKVTLDNIRHALDYPWYEGALEGYENKFIVLGTDHAGNLLEIMYNGNGGRCFECISCSVVPQYLFAFARGVGGAYV
jgi:hypothetical protein